MSDAFKFASDPLDFSGERAGKAGAEAQGKQNAAERAHKKELADQARGELFELFPAAQINRELGTQAALDVFGQIIRSCKHSKAVM